MGLFKKRDPENRPMTRDELMERSKVDGIRFLDLQVVSQLAKQGCDLKARRHVIFYLYLPDAAGAAGAAEGLRGRGHQVEVREPAPDNPKWVVVAETHDRPLIPDFLRETADVCDELARVHGGEYDGWEAGPDLP